MDDRFEELKNYACLLAQELQEYVDDCDEPGCQVGSTELLLQEWEAFYSGLDRQNRSITRQQHSILRHALGLDAAGVGNSNCYVSWPSSPDCLDLVKNGLMRKGVRHGKLMAFHATRLGKSIAEMPYDEINDHLIQIESMIQK